MPRPYSLDLRTRVVDAVIAGETVRAVAQRFGVAVSTVVKWSQRARATGSPAAKQMGGYRRHVLEPERSYILSRLAEEPELTVQSLRQELAEQRGKMVCRDTLWRFLRREGLSFKKNRIRR